MPAIPDARPPAGRQLLILFALVLLTRIPFLAADYGIDPDDWRIALSAEKLFTEHTYIASRRPGHPVHEFLCGLIWPAGPQALNALTAAISALGAVLFARCLLALGVRGAFAGGVALASIPAVWVSSTTPGDFVWGLTLLSAALLASLRRRPVLAGP